MENNQPIIIETESGKTYAWCTCKQSKNFPHCDGSHKDSGMTPIVQTITQSVPVAICACGKSGNSVYCDGTHTK